MKARLCALLFLASCATTKTESKPPELRSGVSNCPAGRLTSACRDKEWPLLRENPQAAAEELEQNCQDASPWACFELGLMLSRWHHLPRDEARGLKFFTKGCNIHLGVSCAAAAQMLEAATAHHAISTPLARCTAAPAGLAWRRAAPIRGGSPSSRNARTRSRAALATRG